MSNSEQEVINAIKESGITFKEWLDTPCLPDDLLPLPWDNEISYLPIDAVRRKFLIMDQAFGATVNQLNVTANVHNTLDKETLIWATVNFIIYHPDFNKGEKPICGTASFLKGQYSGWAFMQIAESIATTRAFSKEFPQFGKGLNKEIDSIKNLKSPTGSKKDSIKNTMNKAV